MMHYRQQMPMNMSPQTFGPEPMHSQHFFPGFPGGTDRRIDRLERQMLRLEREVERLDRRVTRLERRWGQSHRPEYEEYPNHSSIYYS